MAALDYVIRRNNANTDTIPNAGSDLLLLWDTAVANVGSGITYAAGTFTLGETGRFLVLVSDQYGTTSGTNNERLNVKTTLTLGGTELNVGYSTGYIRKSGGSQEFINFSAGVIEVTSTAGNADELQIRSERIDNTVGAGQEPDRIADRSGITILKLDDSWNYGRYSSSAAFTTSATDNTAVVANLQTTVEEDSPFTRTTNTIDIATTNYVLAIYSLKSEDPAPSGRAEYQGRLTLGGSVVPGSYTQTYIRVTDNSDWGGMSNVCLLNPTSGQDLELEVVSRENGNEDFEAELQLIELPISAEAIIVEATTGDFNAAGTDFAWDTNPVIDTAAFTHTAGQANIDVDNAGDYLVFASQATETFTSATRAVPAISFRVNTTDINYVGNSSYNRNSGSAGFGAIATGTLLTGLAANDSVYTRNARIGTNGTAITSQVGGMSMIRLSSLGGLTPPAYDQTSFRIRNDDGSESTATWKAAINTNVTSQSPDDNIRLRFLVQEDNDVVDENVQFQLQYNRNGGGWNDVNASSNVARSSLSTNITDGGNTTQQLGAGTFVTPNAGLDEANGLVGGASLDFSATVNEEVEVEFCFQIRSADTNSGDTIQFRVVKEADEVFDTYTNTPTITVGTPAYTQTSFRLRNDDGSESAASWKQAVNIDDTIKPDENFRVRFLIQETNDIVDPDAEFQLQYNLAGGGWNNVNGSSNVVRSFASSNVADGSNTTQQIGAGTFVTPNAGFDESNGLAGGSNLDFSPTINEEVELEYCVQIRSADTTALQTLQLRVIKDGSPIDTYTNTPTITVSNLVSYTQTSFRFRNDDGSESAASWIAAINTNVTQDLTNSTFRLRFLIQETNDVEELNQDFKLQYNRNSTGWNDVNGSSNVARSTASPNVADGANTTQQLGAGTFVTPNAGFDESDGTVGGASLDFTTTANQEVELEFALQVRDVDTDPGDIIEFRVVEGDSTVLDTYSNTPTLTLPVELTQINGVGTNQLTRSTTDSTAVGIGFGASQGTGNIQISATNSGGGFQSSTSITSWNDTTIVFDFNSLRDDFENVQNWVRVVNDDGTTSNLVEIEFLPLIDFISDSTLEVDQTNVQLGAWGKNATQGTGVLELANNSDYNSATVIVEQSIDTWVGGSNIQFDVVGASFSGEDAWLFLTNDEGFRSDGFQVTILESPRIDSIDDDTFPPDTQNLVLTGFGFEALQGTGTVEIGDNINYGSATLFAQSVDTWSNTSIQFDADNVSTLVGGNAFVFVTNDSNETTTGLTVTITSGAVEITDATSPLEIISLNATASGSGFGNLQGTGKIEIGDNASYSLATLYEQEVDSWSEDLVQFDVNVPELNNSTSFLFITNDNGLFNTVGFTVSINSAFNGTALLNYTTIDGAESTAGWSGVGGGGNIAVGDYPPRQGANTIQFDVGAGATDAGIRTNAGSTFDVTEFEVGIWFLNIKVNNAGTELLGTTDDALRLRLYSGANFADYDQGQFHIGSDGTYNGGWLYLRASGGPGSESSNSGTWGSAQATSVDSVAVILNTNGSNTGKNDGEYAVDWPKYYSKITVTGYNGTASWTLQDLFDEDQRKEGTGPDDAIWGVVDKQENFYRFFCGLEFGDSNGTAGCFEAANEYIYLRQSSEAADYNLTVNDNYILKLGEKDRGQESTYAISGVQINSEILSTFTISTTERCAPTLTVEEGGSLVAYGTLFKGFGTVSLGGLASTSNIELLRCDFFDNDFVEFRSTGLEASDIKLHFREGEEAPIGTVFSVPELFEDIRVFQTTDGLEFQVDVTVDRYVATDNEFDVLVNEGNTVTLVSSTFDETKLKRTT